MKVMDRNRQKKLKQDLRDAKAFNVMMWYLLIVLHHEPWNWGKKRLQRFYDTVLETMYADRNDKWVGLILEDWAIKMELTEEAFWKRKAAKDNG